MKIARGYELEFQGTPNKYKVILKRDKEKRTIGVVDHTKNTRTTDRKKQHIVLYDHTIGFNRFMLETLPSDMIVKIGRAGVPIHTILEKGKGNPLVDYKHDEQWFVPMSLFNISLDRYSF